MLNNFNNDFFKLARTIDDPIAFGKELSLYLQRELKADRCSIVTKNKVTGEIEIRAESAELDHAVSREIINQVMESGESVFLENASAEPDCSRSISRYEFLSIIGIPLTFQHKLLGVMYFDRITDLTPFHPVNFEKAKYYADDVSKVILNQGQILDLNHEVRLAEFHHIIGSSKTMQNIYRLIRKAAETIITVYIHGETGTGKELVAHAIHKLSNRKNFPLKKVNCGALPYSLINAELFGSEKGSFTDSKTMRKGVFEQAHKGTLFLDEIGEIPYNMQAKLLRAVENKEITRLGGEKSIPIDVKIIVASQKNLELEAEKNNFRTDLFHRISELQIDLPPLRERKEDIPLLAQHFLEIRKKELNTPEISLSVSALNALQFYDWKSGNVRELRNTIFNAMIKHEDNGKIAAGELNIDHKKKKIDKTNEEQLSLKDILEETAYNYISQIYEENDRNISATARISGVSRNNIYKILGFETKNKRPERRSGKRR